MRSEWEIVQDFIVQVDARLYAFTDRQIKYFVQDELTCYKVHALMFLPLLEKAGMLTMTLSKLTMMHPMYDSERLVHVFIDYWIEKIKLPRRYEELDVVLDSPPSWAVVPE